MSVIIRPIGPQEWPLLREIRLESLLNEPDAYGLTYAEAIEWGPEKWRERLESRSTFVAVDGPVVVGTANGAPHDTMPGEYLLFGMYVTPAHRGTGLAIDLIDVVSAWAWAHGAREIDLFVNVELPRARGLYAKAGFVDTAEIHRPDRKPELAMVRMQRSLAEWQFAVRLVDAPSLYPLRRRVLRENSPDADVADPRDGDVSSRHYGGFIGPRLVVSASFYPTASPVDGVDDSWQLRYCATDFDVQGRGFGAAVLARALSDLRAAGAQQVWANARDTALRFYQSTGWRVVENSEHVSAQTNLPHTVIYQYL